MNSKNREWSPERVANVRRLVQRLHETVQGLNKEFEIEGRRFTPDGHLVGSIGEVLAAYAFDLELLPPSTSIHDAKAPDGRLVQVKLTGGRGIGLYEVPDHLIVLHWDRMKITLVYNGPGSPVWTICGPQQKNGQRMISLRNLKRLKVVVGEKLQQVRDFPL